MTHPTRHLTTGGPCLSTSPDACEAAFPGTHHAPRHCRPERAELGTSPIAYSGRRRKSTIELAQDALDMARSLDLDGATR